VTAESSIVFSSCRDRGVLHRIQQLHGPAHLPGGDRRDRLDLRVRLRPEAAAHLRRDHLDPVQLEPEDVGEVPADHVQVLATRVDGEALVAVAGDGPVRLEWAGPVHRVLVVALEDERGLRKRGVDITPPDGVLLTDVRGRTVVVHVRRSQCVGDAQRATDAWPDLMHERGAGRHRLLGGEDRGKLLELDPDVPDRLLGGQLVLRYEDCDGFTDEANLVDCQHGVIAIGMAIRVRRQRQ
jgi:hypothetical protein